MIDAPHPQNRDEFWCCTWHRGCLGQPQPDSLVAVFRRADDAVAYRDAHPDLAIFVSREFETEAGAYD